MSESQLLIPVDMDKEEVANLFENYNLNSAAVVDKNNKLVGMIMNDDVLTVLKEEAEEDYQLAAGILQDVDVDDTIFELTKARLPWLIVGLIGGIGAAFVMVGFDEILIQNEILFYFTPLIAAMAGNVGVQSSAIIVQGLANDDIRGSINNRLFKETLFFLTALNIWVMQLSE